MDKAVSRICSLDLMMKYVQFQVKKRLSHEVSKVIVELSSAVGLSVHPPLSATEESGRASISRPRAKREISALSAAGAFSQAKRETGAKPNFTYPR